MPRFIMLMLSLIIGAVVVSGMRAPSASRGTLLVANKGEHTLGIIDPESGKQVATVPEGGITGHEVIASPDGKLAYVPIYGDSGVGKPGSDGSNLVVIDIASRKVMGNVDFGKGVRPHCPMFGPKDGFLYVSTELDNSVTAIDPHTLKIVGRFRPEIPSRTCSRSRTTGTMHTQPTLDREQFPSSISKRARRST